MKLELGTETMQSRDLVSKYRIGSTGSDFRYHTFLKIAKAPSET